MSKLFESLLGRKPTEFRGLELSGAYASAPEPVAPHPNEERPCVTTTPEHAESDAPGKLRIMVTRQTESAVDGAPPPPRRGPAADHPFEAGLSHEFKDWNVARVRVRQASLSAWCPVMSSAYDQSYAAEQYRIVRTNIVKKLDEPFRLVVTSPGIGDGKTLTTVNLAAAMALKSNGRTLLIDADLRRANAHNYLHVPKAPGLSEVLSGTCSLEEAIFAVSDLPRLYVLPAGQPEGNPTELLDSAAWRALAELVRRDFTQVIVDCPPVEVVADYDLIAAVCEGVVLVVRPDHTDRTRCLAALNKLRPKLTGVLLNDTPEWFLWKRSADSSYYHYYRQQGKQRHSKDSKESVNE